MKAEDYHRRVPADHPTVRRATGTDVPGLSDMLVRAFEDDPVANFMFTGPRRRRLGLHSFFTSQLRRQYLPYHQVDTTEARDGVAIWGPPERPRQGLRELFQLLPTAPYLAPRVVRALKLLFEIDALHPKEPHWYLATLGTEPSRQGHGIGSTLLRTALARVDEEGSPAYLESSKERNVPLYARFGFEVIDEHRSAGSPPIWRMWREPRPPEV